MKKILISFFVIILLLNFVYAITKEELRENLINTLNAYFENPSENSIDIDEINGQIDILFGGTSGCPDFGSVICNADQYFDNGQCINAELSAELEVSISQGIAPLTVSFDCFGISNFGPYSYTLDFGDGSPVYFGDGSPVSPSTASVFDQSASVSRHSGAKTLISTEAEANLSGKPSQL